MVTLDSASTAERVVSALSSYWPWTTDVDGPAGLQGDLYGLGWNVSATELVRAGYVSAVGLGSLTLCLSVVAGLAMPVAVLLAVACAGVVVEAVHRTPGLLARLRRTRALCASSDLVGRMVLRARLSPSTERAATFAARTGSDPLTRSLEEHVRRAAGTPRSGLEGFVEEWSEWFPELTRAVTLISTGVESPEADREELLDRALSTVVDATRDRMESFATDIRGPATAIYAFGVLLPLALVGILPAARVGGLSLPLAVLAVVYDVVLPAGLVCATVWLLARRPVTFAPPRDIDVVAAKRRSRPRWLPVLVAGSAGGCAWVAAGTLVAGWTAPLAAVGVGTGSGLLCQYHPAKRIHDRVSAVESDLGDAISLIGRRVRDGDPVEVALAAVAEDSSGVLGERFAEAVAVQRRLRIPLSAAFLGEFGVFRDLPSPRVRAAASVLAIASVEGRPAGETLVTMGEQLRVLDRVEREGARQLSSVTDTLANTATAFGPLVGGATVSLSARITAVDAAAAGVGGGFSTPALGTVLGVYALVMAATLTALSVGLQSGLDRTLVGYRVGGALVAAVCAFLVGFVAAGLLV